MNRSNQPESSGSDNTALAHEWVEIPEDGDPQTLVFKRADADIPPSRRPRRALSLDADGTARVLEPGPADRRVPVAEGSWELDSGRLSTDLNVLGGNFTVEQPDPRTLILHPTTGPDLGLGRPST